MTISLLLVALCSLGASQAPGGLPYEKIARDFAEPRGIDLSGAPLSLEEVYSRHHLRLPLGAFEVLWPVSALERDPDKLKDCALALLGAQERWLDWLQPAGGGQKALREDLKDLTGWVRSWRPQALARQREAGGKDALELLGAPEKIAAAGARLARALTEAREAGAPRAPGRAVRLVFAPTRRDFAELLSYAGWVRSELRDSFWSDGLLDWTQSEIDADRVITLQFAAPGRAAGDWWSGVWMNERDPEVMQQQVVQLAMNSLLLERYGERAPAAFLGGLSMNLVIDQFGMVNTRVDGDLRGRTAGKREVFVPGGASEGGVLMKNSAETRWREDQGKGHFLTILRLAQKEGQDLDRVTKNKPACFAVRSDKGGDKHLVQAPFLGSAAAATQIPPPEFQGDFAEMLRAYKSAFIHWLQCRSGTTEKTSRETFARLLTALADPALESGFEAVFGQIYDGAPLSSPACDKQTLEGRFLIWLSKQR